MLQSGISTHTEADLFALFQHKLMLGMTSENYMSFASKKCLNVYSGQNSNLMAWARTKGEVKGGNALFGE